MSVDPGEQHFMEIEKEAGPPEVEPVDPVKVDQGQVTQINRFRDERRPNYLCRKEITSSLLWQE